MRCPRNQCIFCLGDNSLSRDSRVRGVFAHGLDQASCLEGPSRSIQVPNAVHYPNPACKGVKPLLNVTVFLNHAAKVHDYFLSVPP